MVPFLSARPTLHAGAFACAIRFGWSAGTGEGLAAATNLGRVASREHWVSDTVAASLLGYGLGSLAWDARRGSKEKKDGPKVSFGPGSVAVSWATE